MRFAEFAAKKEAAAIAAVLHPFRTERERPPGDAIAIGTAWTRRWFDGQFYVSPPRADVPSTSLVFVQSRDGNTVAADPSSLGGGTVDTHVVYEGLSRVSADAVLAGAQTLRGGRIVWSVWHPELVTLRASLGLPRHPVQIVATLRGIAIEDALIFNVPDVPVVLLTTPSAYAGLQPHLSARPWISAIVMETPNDLASAFRRLRARGIRRISCIGGRTLARELMAAALVDDLYLTTSAKDGGEPNTPLVDGDLGGEIVVRKRGTGDDRGVVFEQIRLR